MSAAFHHLIVRNGVTDVVPPIVVAAAAVYSCAPGECAVRLARSAAASFMLSAEAGGTTIRLARAMSRLTTDGLLTDVSRMRSLR